MLVPFYLGAFSVAASLSQDKATGIQSLLLGECGPPSYAFHYAYSRLTFVVLVGPSF